MIRLAVERQYIIRALTVVSILLLALAVRLYQIELQVVWFDEAYSVWLSRMPPAQIILFTARDVHPPLYYLLLHVWMYCWGDSVVAVRSLSAVIGVATVAMGMRIAHQFGCWRTSAMAGLLLAVFPIGVYYSQETRMYALLGLLMLSALYAVLLWGRQQRQRYLLAYSLLMVAGLYTHYFAILCALSCWLYVLLARGQNGRLLICSGPWWIYNLGIALAFLPWLPTLIEQTGRPNLIAWIAAVTPMTVPLAFLRAFTLDTNMAGAILLAVAFSLTLLAGATRLWSRDQALSRPGSMLVIYCFIPVLATWLVSSVKPLFMERYLLFALLGLPILLASALAELRQRWRVLLLVLCVFFEAAGMVNLYSRQFNLRGGSEWVDNRLDYVMAQVNSRWLQGDALLADDRVWSLTIDFYNKTGTAPLVYKPYYTDPAIALYPRVAQRVVNDPRTLEHRYKRVWWVTSGPVTEIERTMMRNWVSLAAISKGDSRALLFAMPDQAASRD